VPGHRFLAQSGPFSEGDFPSRSVRGCRQVVDASLLALSRKHEARLVSFDKGLRQLAASDGWETTLHLL
jgi:predicted nucleic acid-binding protein